MTTETTALQDHCAKLRPEIRLQMADAAEKAESQAVAIANLLEVAAQLQFLEASNLPTDGSVSTAWTNTDAKRAYEELAEYLQAIAASTPLTHF